jgi:hypothetical protein
VIRLTRRRDSKSLPKDFVGAKLVDKHGDLVDRYFAAQASGKPMAFVSTKWKSAKSHLRRDTGKKCAYCEAPTSTVAHGDVEHFRPKSLYWWLAYRFDNYLFACQICNQIYKGDNFPISGRARLVAPSMPRTKPTGAARAALAATLAIDPATSDDANLVTEWQTESADLVHPYLEDPETLFVYDVDDSNQEIWIKAAPHPRAQRARAASEAHLGLNREELRRDRFVLYSMLAIIKASYDSPSLSPALKTKIEAHFAVCRKSDHPYAGMHRYFLKIWGLA